MSQIKCSALSLKSYAMLFLAGKGGIKHNPIPLAKLIHGGNMKLPKSTAIFNLSSATDCLSRRLGLCKAAAQKTKCYALKGELNHCSRYVLPYRRAQERFWLFTSAEEFVSQFVMLNSLRKIAFTAIRFCESGDFHGQHDLEKVEKVAKMLRRFGIRCYCYTSRSDLNFSKIKHLIVSGSNFLKPGIANRFRIVRNLKERMKGESLCKQDCRVCRKCLMHHLKIVIKNH